MLHERNFHTKKYEYLYHCDNLLSKKTEISGEYL